MREATENEIVQITRHDPRTPSHVLSTLIQHPNVWYHIALNEYPAHGGINEQRDAIDGEAAWFGYEVRTAMNPGHSDGGFFAALVGRTRMAV